MPRRNQSDNSTDMSSFPFVRHHFLRAGFEVIDCPPLTAQLKNSADIRMVMDVRDILTHDTYFDEFVILSADADFTPVLHRLRSHARRTVVFSNDHTAAPYTAICDAEIREADLLALLLDGQLPTQSQPSTPSRRRCRAPRPSRRCATRSSPRSPTLVRAADQPVPLEALADRCVRMLGHDKTVGAAWGGTGSFRDLLTRGLPDDIRLTASRPTSSTTPAAPPSSGSAAHRDARASTRIDPRADMAAPSLPRTSRCAPRRRCCSAPGAAARRATRSAACRCASRGPRPGAARPAGPGAARNPLGPAGASPPAAAPAPQRTAQGAAAIQQSIARIHEASQAPTLSPQDYRTLFDVMAQEIAANGLAGAQTLVNIVKRAESVGIEIRRDDVRFVLDVVSEADPWFDQGASPSLFAWRFRNFVVARCRGQGLNLSADELDLIEAWFAAPVGPARAPPRPRPGRPVRRPRQPQPRRAAGADPRSRRRSPAQARSLVELSMTARQDQAAAGTGDDSRASSARACAAERPRIDIADIRKWPGVSPGHLRFRLASAPNADQVAM